MKTILFFVSGTLILLPGCVNEQHYYPIEPRPTYIPQGTKKTAPNVSDVPASDFRAVERPATYSQ